MTTENATIFYDNITQTINITCDLGMAILNRSRSIEFNCSTCDVQALIDEVESYGGCTGLSTCFKPLVRISSNSFKIVILFLMLRVNKYIHGQSGKTQSYIF